MREYNMKPVNPARMPYFTLVQSGAQIPAIGFGTFGSDHITPAQMAAGVDVAVRLGYRHIDCAAVYANEGEIGAVLDRLYADGVVRREDLWLTSKVWNDHHHRGDVLLSCAQTLRDLRTGYLDLLLIHWPFPNYHSPGCSAEARSPDATPYIHEEFMRTYRQLERLVEAGLVRHIGISNVTVKKLKLILRDCRIKPAVNEMELHPNFQQPVLYEFSRENGLLNIGYCPLGSPHRPERDRDPDDCIDMEDPVVLAIARSHGCHPAAVCLKWGVQRGHVVIPASTNPINIRANLEAVCSDPLTVEEMAALARIDRNCRLIKGHVFLWPEARDWQDLWDM